jgi:hypothetical protein
MNFSAFKSRVKMEVLRLSLWWLKPSRLPLDANVAICSLVCHRDLAMYIHALRSLFAGMKKQLPVVVLNDGSLTGRDKEVLNMHFQIKIISLADARKKIKKLLKNFPVTEEYLLSERNDILKYKLAVLWLSSYHKNILMDADVLFFQKPTLLVDWIEKGDDWLYVYHPETCFQEGYFPEHSFRKIWFASHQLTIEPCFNAGLLALPKPLVTQLEHIEKCFVTLKHHGIYVLGAMDEFVLAWVFAKNKALPLPAKSYRVYTLWKETREWGTNKVVMRHFSYETKGLFMRQALNLAKRHHYYRDL